MGTAAPKTIADARAQMRAAVAAFRERAATRPTEVTRLAARARTTIERVRKQFRHHIEDQLRRDAKRHWGLTDAGRLGLTRQLEEAATAVLAALDEAVRRHEPYPGGRLPSRGGSMEFQAAVVEAYLGEFDIHTVHFDDGQEHYLQLRTPEVPMDPREVESGYGLVEVEVNDQLYGGVNCFSAAELRRNRFRLVLARDEGLVREFGEVVVTFALDDEAFTKLRQGLERIFRDFPAFQVDVGN